MIRFSHKGVQFEVDTPNEAAALTRLLESRAVSTPSLPAEQSGRRTGLAATILATANRLRRPFRTTDLALGDSSRVRNTIANLIKADRLIVVSRGIYRHPDAPSDLPDADAADPALLVKAERDARRMLALDDDDMRPTAPVLPAVAIEARGVLALTPFSEIGKWRFGPTVTERALHDYAPAHYRFRNGEFRDGVRRRKRA
jgi:hypothetical protein